MVKRAKRYDDGGDVREGPNENIGDDTRRRAMEAVRRRLAGEADAEEPVAPVARATPRAPRVAGPDQSAAETARLRAAAGLAERKRLEREDLPLESVHPEMMLPPGRVMKGLQGLASAAARRFAPAAESAASRELIPAAGRELARVRPPRELNTIREPFTPRLPGPRDSASIEGAAGVPRLPGPSSAPRLRGPDAAARRAEQRSARERTLEEEIMQGEGGRYKRGGKVKAYANGGTVSASRRADGIAQRGKTRGRVR